MDQISRMNANGKLLWKENTMALVFLMNPLDEYVACVKQCHIHAAICCNIKASKAMVWWCSLCACCVYPEEWRADWIYLHVIAPGWAQDLVSNPQANTQSVQNSFGGRDNSTNQYRYLYHQPCFCFIIKPLFIFLPFFCEKGWYFTVVLCSVQQFSTLCSLEA